MQNLGNKVAKVLGKVGAVQAAAVFARLLPLEEKRFASYRR